MGVLDAKILQPFNDLLQPIEICFSNMRPSHKNDSLIDPPSFLITWIYDRFVDPFNLNTAYTAN
jgi:hypothetical protein